MSINFRFHTKLNAWINKLENSVGLSKKQPLELPYS